MPSLVDPSPSCTSRQILPLRLFRSAGWRSYSRIFVHRRRIRIAMSSWKCPPPWSIANTTSFHLELLSPAPADSASHAVCCSATRCHSRHCSRCNRCRLSPDRCPCPPQHRRQTVCRWPAFNDCVGAGTRWCRGLAIGPRCLASVSANPLRLSMNRPFSRGGLPYPSRVECTGVVVH